MMEPQQQRARVSNVWMMKAHDIRDVTSRVLLAAEELSRSSEPRTRLLAGRLLSACDRIVEICEDATRQHIDRCHGDLMKTIGMVVELAEFAAEPGTTLKVDVSHNAGIRRDGIAIFRILANLTNNAVSAVNEAGGGEVIVRCSIRLGKPTISVENVLKTSAAPASGRNTSSGLGLLIAMGIADDIGAALHNDHSAAGTVKYSVTLDNCTLTPPENPPLSAVN
ncbi:MAG: hypothetical protein AAGK37_20155 [Pseudomonadota bacterium]